MTGLSFRSHAMAMAHPQNRVQPPRFSGKLEELAKARQAAEAAQKQRDEIKRKNDQERAEREAFNTWKQALRTTLKTQRQGIQKVLETPLIQQKIGQQQFSIQGKDLLESIAAPIRKKHGNLGRNLDKLYKHRPDFSQPSVHSQELFELADNNDTKAVQAIQDGLKSLVDAGLIQGRVFIKVVFEEEPNYGKDHIYDPDTITYSYGDYDFVTDGKTFEANRPHLWGSGYSFGKENQRYQRGTVWIPTALGLAVMSQPGATPKP